MLEDVLNKINEEKRIGRHMVAASHNNRRISEMFSRNKGGQEKLHEEVAVQNKSAFFTLNDFLDDLESSLSLSEKEEESIHIVEEHLVQTALPFSRV